MNNMRFPKIIFKFITATLLLGGFVLVPVSAQSSSANAAQGIQISPTLVELNAARGKPYNIKLNIMNVTASDLVYSESVDDFNSANETGSPHIILNSDLPTTTSVKTWISTIPKFTIKAGKYINLDVQVVIPNNAEPGGYYGVIRFSGTAPELESTGVGLSASAGVLILIRVDGTITEKASLVSFYSAQNGNQSSFFENSPITFVTRIQNEGNIHVKPIGSVELRDMFGNLLKNISVNKDKSNVLPGSIRRFESQYDNTWMIGRYTANLTLGYGTTGQAITNTINFWVIPWKLILVALSILATIIFILVRLIKVYNRHIIEKAKNENSNKNKNQYKKKD